MKVTQLENHARQKSIRIQKSTKGGSGSINSIIYIYQKTTQPVIEVCGFELQHHVPQNTGLLSKL